jgi:hypothetical protein
MYGDYLSCFLAKNILKYFFRICPILVVPVIIKV